MIRLKRAYDPVEEEDGARFLVDRLWPRGIRKGDLEIEAWLKEIAPSNDLRRWYGHKPEKWDEFKARYYSELDEGERSLRPLREATDRGTITLIYAARDREHNNAVALREYLETKRHGRKSEDEK
jgi:uncharacterized protein YeaO (DUF488 family)